uniref:Guanylate-binding protein 5-like n=1 Tax=Dermatophagoides pteronyssinus TaxID=6956 RepID=A0A6P6YJH3_DERPT
PPVAVVTSVGSIHSGKSFLMNQLANSIVELSANSDEAQLALPREDEFSVGSGTEAETEGIWTLPRVLRRGNISLLLLDTEGLFSRIGSEMNDAKVFSIAALMSSEFIYNTVKFIDSKQIEALETLMRRASLFGLRSYSRRNAHSEGRKIENLANFINMLTPSHLSWIIRDFVQDLHEKTPQEWDSGNLN